MFSVDTPSDPTIQLMGICPQETPVGFTGSMYEDTHHVWRQGVEVIWVVSSREWRAMSCESHGLDVHPATWSSLEQSAEWEKKEHPGASMQSQNMHTKHILQGHIQTQ